MIVNSNVIAIDRNCVLNALLISFFNVFFIDERSKPPNLNILGLFLISIIVDSTPIEDFPPSIMNLIFLVRLLLKINLKIGLKFAVNYINL